MGNMLSTLTAPGALDTLRWQWLSTSPEGPADLADVLAQADGWGAVKATAVALEEAGEGVPMIRITSTVPTPPGWPSRERGRSLGGLALLGPNGDVLAVRWIDPPVRAWTRSVQTVLVVVTGV